jgi:hypothetical protein
MANSTAAPKASRTSVTDGGEPLSASLIHRNADPRSAPAALCGQGRACRRCSTGTSLKQPGHVAAHHEPGQLERLAILVDARVPHIQHGHTRPQMSRHRLVGPVHPHPDFLLDAGHDMLLLLQDAVDAELVRHFGLEQSCAFRDRPRDVGGHPVHRIPQDQGIHALRHTAASAWLSAAADIVAVAAWLGGAVDTVDKTYAHLMPDADDRGRKAIDQFFRRPGGEPSALDVPSDDDK